MSAAGRARAQALNQYGHLIGRSVLDALTPALVLDLPALRRNLDRMATRLAGTGTALRPHAKTHKCVQIARLQHQAGAIGMSVATVWEAAVLAESGLDNIFVINQVAEETKIRVLAELARSRRMLVAADHIDHATRLSAAAVAAGASIGVAVEVDTGMRRCGVSTEREVVTLAERIAHLPGLEFAGITGYEGHCSLEDDPDRRRELHGQAMATLQHGVAALHWAGLACPIVSAGGTRTWSWTAKAPGVTEIQAGTYALMDAFHTGVEGGFEQAVYVLATTISAHADRIVLDAGSKTIGDADLSRVRGSDQANLGCDEEHARFAADAGRRRIGERVWLVPGYAPTTVNNFDSYLVVAEEQVVDVWPVVPRGPGDHGLGSRHPQITLEEAVVEQDRDT